MNTEFSRQIFEKFSDIKFHENPACGSRAVPQGRSARHDEALIDSLSNFVKARDEWHTSYYQQRSGLSLSSQHYCWKFSAARDVSLHCGVESFPLSGHSWEGLAVKVASKCWQLRTWQQRHILEVSSLPDDIRELLTLRYFAGCRTAVCKMSSSI